MNKLFLNQVAPFAMAGAVAVAAGLLMLACSEGGREVGGGVSEEENTLVGILVDGNGDAVVGARISARYFKVDTVVLTDTTDEEGKFGMKLSLTGRYGLSAQTDSSAFYQTVEYDGSEIEVSATLAKVGNIKGMFNLRPDTSAAGVSVYIPGSNWKVMTGDDGEFSIENVPTGIVPIIAKSPDPMHFTDVVYMVEVGEDSVNFIGPLPRELYDSDMFKEQIDSISEVETEMPVEDFPKGSEGEMPVYAYKEVSLGVDNGSMVSAVQDAKTLQFPLSSEYGLRSWFSMDYLNTTVKPASVGDVRGWTEGLLVYGGATLGEGVENSALVLKDANQYGVIENDRGLLDSATEFVFEAWVEIDSVLTNDSAYRKNIVGKLGFGSDADQDVFSFALVKGECGVEGEPVFAFFFADGLGDTLSCNSAVVSKRKVEFGKWVYVTAVFDGKRLSLYLDGALAATRTVEVEKIGVSSESIFFGKEAINLKLDDVRFGVKALTASDVQYRYYLKGGAQ